MKIPTFITVLALAFVASSCRTSTPIDPMTGKPSDRCLPGYTAPSDCTRVHPTK